MALVIAAIFGYFLAQVFIAVSRETDYADKLDHQRRMDRLQARFPDLALNISEERITPMFPELTQLWSWSWMQQLRMKEDGRCEYPGEDVWIYVGGRKTCPSSDGIVMCENFIAAFNKLIEYSHVNKLARSAILAFVDCDISDRLCQEWGITANVMVNFKSFGPCKSHEPVFDFDFRCPTSMQFFGLPLLDMPTRDLRRFPSAFEQLLSLTTVDGFIDMLEPINEMETETP